MLAYGINTTSNQARHEHINAAVIVRFQSMVDTRHSLFRLLTNSTNAISQVP
jgi:hypothetical protein